MRHPTTLFILGAGASKEADLPTGAELKEHIARDLDIRFQPFGEMLGGDHLIYRALEDYVRNTPSPRNELESYVTAGWHIRDAMPQALSIDNFIDTHHTNTRIALCGKLGITRCILESERLSRLYIEPTSRDRRLSFHRLADSWYDLFIKLVTESCPLDQLKKRFESLALIIFNYDRCFEHYLFNALKNYYGIGDERSAELIGSLTIYHPYGTVGTLPWTNKPDTIPFGGQPNASQLLELSANIRTFAEGTDPNRSDVASIRELVANSGRLIFLGFAYHTMNLDILRSPFEESPGRNGPEYIGTAIGISTSDCELLRSDLLRLAGGGHDRVWLHTGLTCCKLFHEHWRRISFLPMQ